MRLDIPNFRGSAPRVSPRLLPDNAGSRVINARLQSGDLESWRQFATTKVLSNPGAVQTIYLLNDRWLSWEVDVDVARGAIPGDDTFRTYLTGPDVYPNPRYTNYALATTGAEPFPVTTRPLGVPAPESEPALVAGVSTNPTQSVTEVLDSGDQLDTAWVRSSNVSLTFERSIVTQEAGDGNGPPCYQLDQQENHDYPCWLRRNFGIEEAQTVFVSFDFEFNDGNRKRMLAHILAQDDGIGPFVRWHGEDGGLTVGIAAGFQEQGLSALSGAVIGAPSPNTWYTCQVSVVKNPDNTRTVRAGIFLGSVQIGTTVTVTNAFVNSGDNVGFSLMVAEHITSSDPGEDGRTRYDNILVRSTVPVDAVTQTPTSYVYTFVNDLGEESAPSPPSSTILKDDGTAITVTTATSVPTSLSDEYGITTKRIYRAVITNVGTQFQFVAEIPLAQEDFVDDLTDAQLGEVLESELWELPPDDLRGIIALPNGVMAGFSKNQLCFSVQNRPHAWPVEWRLNTDTDIVAIGNIDTTVIIGTKAFPYLAIGNDPSAYSMTKLEVQQACVAKRSLAYLTQIGVVFASPDGLIAISGNGQVRNLTETIFTRRQWQALVPETILGVAHDDVYHFWFDSEQPSLSVDDVSHTAVDGTEFMMTVTRTGALERSSSVQWTVTGDVYTGSGEEGFEPPDNVATGSLEFAPGESAKTITFVLHVSEGITFDATVTLSNPEQAVISDGTGLLTATEVPDPFFANVGYLLHFNDPSQVHTYPDVIGNVWSRQGSGGTSDILVSASDSKFGGAGLLIRTRTGTSSDCTIAAFAVGGDYTLQAGNKFTLEAWLNWTGAIDSRPIIGRIVDSTGTVIASIEFNTTNQIKFRTQLDVLDERVVNPPLNQWIHVALSYDGTTKYWFVNGALSGSAAVAVGAVKTIRSYSIGGIASGNAFASDAFVDETRFTFDVCRYTATFTPPADPFPNL